MYRIHICDSGYEVLCDVVKNFAEICMKDEDQTDEDVAAYLGCLLLLDDLKQATHIQDKK